MFLLLIVYLESTTPEVFTTSSEKMEKIHPSETAAKNSFFEHNLLILTRIEPFLTASIQCESGPTIRFVVVWIL